MKIGFVIADENEYYPFLDFARENGAKEFKAKVIGEKTRTITLKMDALTDAEKQIILKGCLINYYKNYKEYGGLWSRTCRNCFDG